MHRRSLPFRLACLALFAALGVANTLAAGARPESPPESAPRSAPRSASGSASGSPSGAPSDASSGSPSAAIEAAPRLDVVAEALEHPWSLAFLPDGRKLVTERPGRLRFIDVDGPSAPIVGVPDVLADSQAGLFDVVPHPDFANNRWVYLSLAHGTLARNATRLMRARLEDDRLVDAEVLFTAMPWKATPVHFGGRIAFLADGTLLLSVGDGFDHREHAQRLDSHLGKVVRLHDDGRVPDDNPFIGVPDALPEIYSIGHRNPQGLAVDADTGAPWLHDHGPAGGDELNLLVAGGNYGWPIATHGRDYSGAAISPFDAYPGTIAPLLHWTPSIAPSGLALDGGSTGGSVDCDVLVAALKARELRCIALQDDGEIVGERTLVSGAGRLRDVRIGPDGRIWLLTDAQAGRLLRLSNR